MFLSDNTFIKGKKLVKWVMLVMLRALHVPRILAHIFTVNPPPAQTIPYAELFPDLGGFILENNNGQGSISQTTHDNRECLMIINNQAGECWHVQAKKVGLVYREQHRVYASDYCKSRSAVPNLCCCTARCWSLG